MSSLSILIFVTLAVISAVNAGPKWATKECKYCDYDYDCETKYCFQHKCLWRNRASLTKCFVGLCGYCKYNSECISGRCYYNKCVPKLRPNSKTCFPYGKPKPSKTPTPTPSTTATATATATATPTPSPKKPDCAKCHYAYECGSGYCTDYFCGAPYSVHYCKKGECKPCEYNYECKSGKCRRGICIKNQYSFHKCW